MAQQVEHVLGKDEVTGSNPVSSSKKRKSNMFGLRFFSGYKRIIFDNEPTAAQHILQELPPENTVQCLSAYTTNYT